MYEPEAKVVFVPMTVEDQQRIYRERKLTLFVDISGMGWLDATMAGLPTNFITKTYFSEDSK